MKRLASLIMILLLLTGCAYKKPEPDKATFHTDRMFFELTESGENAELEIARARELLFRIERGELNGERAQAALDARAEAYEKLNSDAAFAYVRYCLDVTNGENKQRYDALFVSLNMLGSLLVDAALLLSKEPSLADRYDAETVEQLRRQDALNDPAIEPLLKRERTLVGQYEALSESLTVEQNGRRWTGDMILSDPTLTDEEFEMLYESYMTLFNAEAGRIFLELVPVRNAIASALGFGSYAEYAYACYDRDYTPDDAAALSETVREMFAPLLSGMCGEFYAAAARLYGAVFEQGPTMERIREAIVALVPELAEPWDYMVKHQMYDFGSDPKRMPGCFTTYFASYGTPFLFGEWTNGFDAPQAVIHEFGHFAAYWLNAAALQNGVVLDLAEIDSQGLELMSVLLYNSVYGDLSDAAETTELFYALYTLLDGCLEDEFQRFAYGQKSLTLDALNDEYERLSAAYGLDMFGIDPRSWTQIPHTFQQPFYYVSYATSMTAALGLYLLCREDKDTAVRIYRSILMRPENTCFRQTLRSVGLADPFDAERLLETAKKLTALLQNRRNEGADETGNGR